MDPETIQRGVYARCKRAPMHAVIGGLVPLLKPKNACCLHESPHIHRRVWGRVGRHVLSRKNLNEQQN